MADTKIQILSRKLIKPSTPTLEHLQYYNLSAMDEFAPLIYWPILFYYPSEGNNGRAKHHKKCDKLEKSLCRILTKFYPLAGRYMENELRVHCGDQGVECIQAQVNGLISDFLQPSESQMQMVSRLLPWNVNTANHSSKSPLLAVQINSFSCGGMVLGISISHVVADAFTLATFMNEWAITSRTGMTEDFCTSVGLLPSLFPAKTGSQPKAPPPSINVTNMVTKTFWFEETKIDSIRDGLVVSDRPFSKVVVVTAMIWKALLEVAIGKHGYCRDSILVLIMNLRDKSKAAPPTIEIAFGNCFIPLMVLFDAEKANVQLHDLMVLVRSAVEKERARFEGANASDILSICLKRRKEMFEEGGGGDADIYLCSSMCRFPLYEADFGWGKPHWVSDACRDFQGIDLKDSNTGGIQACITLREEDMNNFLKNLDISAYVPVLRQKI